MLLPVVIAFFLQTDPAALRPLYQQALDRRRAALVPSDPRTAQAARDLGLFLASLPDLPSARIALADTVRLDEQTFGPVAPQTLADVAELAAVSPPRLAEPLWQRAAAATDPTVAIRALMAIGDLRAAAHLRPAAAVFYRKALARQEHAAGPDSPAIPKILQALAAVTGTPEAIPLLQRALVVGRATQGAHHPANALIEAALASRLLTAGRTDEALAAAADALAIDQETVGIGHPRAARAMVILARVLHAQKQPERAESMFRLALSIDEKAYGPRHPQTLDDIRTLAKFLRESGRVAEAADLERKLPR